MNNLAVTTTEADVKNILAELGGEEEHKIQIDFLKICHDGEDKQGREIKRGLVSLSRQEDPVWASEAKVHILAQYFQYREQDETGKVLNKTMLQQDFRKGEALDQRGTLRCGKPTRKVLDQMSDDDKKMWAMRVKTTRIIRGIISYTGHTADGTEVEVTNTPFQHYMKGSGYMDFEKVIDSMPYGKQYHDYILKMNTEKRGKYYYTTYGIDFDTPAILNADVADTARIFQEMAKRENTGIQKKYSEALMSNKGVDQVYDAVAGGDLNADLH